MNKRSRLDYYALEAQRQGYPARSVFKLEEIQNRYNLIRKGQKILDVGAAPGSWTLFVLRRYKALVSAVDLNPLSITVPKNAQLRFFQEDIFTDKVDDFLRIGGPYACILSDVAPSTTGNRLVDTSKSLNLVLRIIDLAQNHLALGGNLVVKIFQGGGEQEVLKKIQELFKETKMLRPKAVRTHSMETYLIGKKFLGVPSKVLSLYHDE